MDNLLGTLIYKITGDSSMLNKDIDVSRAKLEKTGVSIEKLGSSIMRLSKTVISGMLIKSLLDASSRVEELQNKFDTVFAGIEAQTNSWVKQYADATNRGITATKEFLATQQDLRTGYGDTIESAARYSQAVVGITNDLASFSNVPVAEAMAAMQSGLSFQFEALRRLGVSLSVATINQGEYAASIGKTWEQMSNLEKQEAVLSGVVSQSKNALHQNIQLWNQYNYTIGDAARTADSFANSSQGAKQKLDDLKAELGDALIPTATAFLHLGIDIMEMFNSWPDAAQAATAATIAFGVAWTTITGPVGIALGSIAALTVLISSAKDPGDRLADTTRNLAEATGGYSEVTRQLAGDTENMTESERNLLEARKALLGLEVQKNLKELFKSYDTTTSQIDKYRKSTEAATAVQDAYSLAASKGAVAVRREIERLEKIQLKSPYDQTYLDNLKTALMTFTLRPKAAMDEWEKELESATKHLIQQQGLLAEKELTLEQAVLEAARAVGVEAVSVEYLAQSYPELYNRIMETANGLKVNTGAALDNKSAVQQAAYAVTDWQTKLKELRAEMAQDSGQYSQAAAIKLDLLNQERNLAIQKLAVDTKLVKAEEDVTTLTTMELIRRIQKNSDASAELRAIQTFYALESQKVRDSSVQSEQEASDKILSIKRAQLIASKQALASDLESRGFIEAAYTLKLEVLQEEQAAERTILARKVADKKATQGELDAFDQAAASKELELRKETDRKLTAERLESAKETKKLLNDQLAAVKEKDAQELESSGSFRQATAIRIALLEQERDKALHAMSEKVSNQTATQQQLDDLNAYYASKEDELRDDQAKKEKDYQDELSDRIAATLHSQQAAVKQSLVSDLESRGWLEAAYRIKLEILQGEIAAERAILARKVADKKATQEELDAFDQVAASKELELRKETDRKLTAERLESAKETKKLLNDQLEAVKEKDAQELESSGSFKEAMAIRIALLEQERDKALLAMQEKVSNQTATQQQLDDLNTYYANKQEQLQKEQADKVKDFWLDVVSTVASTVTSMSNDLASLLSAQTDAQLAAIDEQTESKLSALGLQEKTAIEKLQDEYAAAVKAGDMELAQEKSRAIEKQRIEDEADKKKQQLQIEQAKREKELNIFTATISMLSAIVKALADPGGWAGVGLSVAAGVTGALQIAAIQAAPLPSFAVGAENIPEDMLAVVHKGESILPAPMAESVRKGEATYGQGSNVMITIINNTGAAVTQEERETDQGREYLISIGKAVDKQISEGRYDRSLGNRYGIRKVGIHG